MAEAEAQIKLGNFQAATDRLTDALEDARRQKSRKDELFCLNRLGLLNWNLGRMPECARAYREALAIARSLDLRKEERDCSAALQIYDLYSEGKIARSQGKYQASVEILQRAVALSKRIQSKEHEVKCLRQMSVNYWELNRFREFYELNTEAQMIAHEINNRREEGLCLNNIGLFYWKLSNYSRALKCFQLSLEIAEEEGAFESKSQSLNNISLIYIDLGYYEKALEYLLRVLKIDKMLNNDNYMAIDLNNIGIILRNRGIALEKQEDLEESIENFEHSLELARKNNNKKIECTVRSNIGETYLSLNDYPGALTSFSTSLKKAYELNDIEMISQLFNNFGNIYIILNRYQEALDYFRRSIELSLKINNEKILWEAYYGLGRCYEKKEDFRAAVESYKKSIEIIDRVRSQIFLDAFKASFVRNKLKVYESFINLLYKLGQKDRSMRFEEEIYYFVEKVKARAFLEGLAESKIDIRENLNQELREEENRISDRIKSIVIKLSRSGLSEKEKVLLGEKLSQEEDSYMRLITKIREENPAAANLVSPELSSVERIQNFMADGKTALLEYFLGEQRSYFFFITKDSVDFYPLTSRQEIEKSVKGYLKILSEPPKKEFLGNLGARRLFNEFLFPLRDLRYQNIEKLIIVPDGILYYLPFEALVSGFRNKAADYLVNRYQVSYAPSSSVLLFLNGKAPLGPKAKGLLAFGDPAYPEINTIPEKGNTAENIMADFYLTQGFKFYPIPYSKNEIREISKLFPKDKRDIYLGRDAREEKVKKLFSKNYQIIHFACHALIDENQPFRSALALSLDDGKEEDGFLQVRELYNLRLNANLVVLSACQTARGKMERGEGILGLTRMFFYSGANSVLSTLWPIDDKSTAYFMTRYYRHLADGRTIAEALRLTKLDMIRSNFSQPYFWAGFVLNGDGDIKIDFH